MKIVQRLVFVDMLTQSGLNVLLCLDLLYLFSSVCRFTLVCDKSDQACTVNVVLPNVQPLESIIFEEYLQLQGTIVYIYV